MLAEALRRHKPKLRKEDVIALFLDNRAGYRSPFSIQNVSKLSTKVGKEPGDWFGCSTISYVLEMANKKYDRFNDFTLAVFNDGVLYLNDILLKASISCKCSGATSSRVVREEDDCNSSYELVVSCAG